MEGNSDNKLREKLSGLEPAFDPAAWDKMEALLDNKKKRRFFIWWWTGGIAAVLLLGMGVYEYSEHTGNQLANQSTSTNTITTVKPATNNAAGEAIDGNNNTTLANNTVNNNKQQVQPAETVIGNNGATTVGGSSNAITDSKRSSAPGIGTTALENSYTLANNYSKATTKTNQPYGRNGNHKAAHAGKQYNYTTAIISNTTGKALAVNNAPAANAKTNKLSSNIIGNGNATLLTNTNSTLPEDNINIKSGITEPVSLQRMEASLLPVAVEETGLTIPEFKEEENILPKARKQVFNYSLGVAAHVSGATVGAEGGNAGNMFYKSPTWMVGFTHDFTFINRIAITNGVLYGQTSFEVKQPKAVNYPVAPIKYNSHISEIAIPIGVKVYPVVKQNFRFYISTGIINHIKLKETFNYTVQDTPVYNSIANDPMGMYPGANDFTGDVKTVGSLASTNLSVSTTNDFAVSAKRYYASYYAGAGFEYIARNHFTLFAEPVFYMGLSKIGVQDKRKYNLGVTGGFRYRF